jgi:hypothetical protein
MHMLPNKPMSTGHLLPHLKRAGKLSNTSIGGRLLEYSIYIFSYTKECLGYTVVSARHRKYVVVSSKMMHN